MTDHTVDFISSQHKSTKRDYVARVVEFPKAECAKVARQFGRDYWDGERQYGYGGYRYDGRWAPIAQAMVAHYGLKAHHKVLDVGCGKAFLLYELWKAVPGLEVVGIDVSQWGIDHAPEEIRPFLQLGQAQQLPFADQSFDFVLSLNVLHNLYNYDLFKALQEIQRVGKQHRYLVVESYRSEEEKANLLYWQLTCESFYTPQEWKWFYDLAGYQGDYSFIYFE